MIERRHPPGEHIRLFVREISGNPKTQMSGYLRHRGHQHHWVVTWRPASGTDGRIRIAAINVEIAENIGDKHAVEFPPLQQPRQLRPMLDVQIVNGAITGIGPLARRRKARRIGFKRVEDDLLGQCVAPVQQD